jgi:glycosyltransferase involved in cell wall biosynthesis
MDPDRVPPPTDHATAARATAAPAPLASDPLASAPPASDPRASGPLADAGAPRVVCMLCPGGTEHAGGIGRWAGYMRTAWREAALSPPLEIVDTRGFGGWRVAAATFARALARLAALRVRGRLGLIHVNLSVRGSSLRKCIIGLLARLAGVKFVLHLHSGRFFAFHAGLPYPGRLALRLLFAAAERVVVLGEVWADRVVAVLGVPRDRITVLYNAAPRPARLARGTPPDGICHIVMLGRLGAPKGVPELLEALAGETLRGRRWRATLAGDGDAAPVLAEAARSGIGGRVACPGWLDADAVSALLDEADILVLASRSENLPVSVIEALAHRVAVVSTRVGSLGELLEDGVSALLVPVRDPPALAGALARLIDDAGLRARIAAGGHAVFRARLDAAVAAPRLAALYRAVMDRAVMDRSPVP